MTVLHFLLETAFPAASAAGVEVLRVLAATEGRPGAVDLFARQLGLTSRHQLARLLHREGLPPFQELLGWSRLLTWLERWETTGMSLCRCAIEMGVDPAACYRLVRRLTGLPWTEVRRRGTVWIVLVLSERAVPRTAPLRVARRVRNR